MVVERDYAGDHELGFAQDPVNLAEKSYVNMYLHHDGYPEWQGVQLANWIQANSKISDGSRIASKLVHDMYYDSCYLYASPDDIDHEYTYVIWTGDREDMWISCYNQYTSRCVFVNKPNKIIERYKADMEYTNFKGGETRLGPSNILHPSGYD
tara:strand:- start:190 stop:648 length:459 start_codon:yes stop_codon:yes gene_type:complete